MKRHFALAAAVLGAAIRLSAQTILPISEYGYMDQYSMNTRHNLVGSDACVPTSTTNALTFLQNSNPSIYGTALSGSGYVNWRDTDDSLISLMGTQAGAGTYDTQFVYGLVNYFATLNVPAPTLSGVFHNAGWGGQYPRPSYISEGHPTTTFLRDALAQNAALVTTISYTSGNGGHGILVNGIAWDDQSKTGTLYFVDPLDPSQNYNASLDPQVLGPTLQTTGSISLDLFGHIVLTYDQYEGGLPFNGGSANFSTVSAVVDGALALYAVPEPGSVALLGIACVFLLIRRRQPAALSIR